jgi:opine dehydrogenase
MKGWSMANLNCSVVGNGALALSVAIQLTQHDCSVTYIDVSENLKIWNRYHKKPEITVISHKRYLITLSEVTNTYESIQNAQIVVIATTSSCYETVFDHVLPMIHADQHVLFMPACYGAILFKNALMNSKVKDMTISEATSFPYVCDFSDEGITVHSKKKTLTMSVSPVERVTSEIRFYNTFFDIFQPARNFLQTSLDNMNLSLHPMPILLNISAVENSVSTFRHYIDGYSPAVSRIVEMMDAERIAIGEKLGLPLTPALAQLKNYYEDTDVQTIREYVTNLHGPYPNIKGFGLSSRYVMEDVASLLVAASNLASALSIGVPAINMCIDLASMITNIDFNRIGFTLKKLGFEGFSKDELLYAVEH